MTFSEIVTPNYNYYIDKWEQFKLLLAGGESLLEKMPKVSAEETTDNYNLRLKYGADKINIGQSVQSQLDVLSLAGIEYEIKDAQLNEIMHETVTKDDKSLLEFTISEALRNALAYGHCFIVIDRLPIDTAQTVSQAEISNSPPYCYVLDPTVIPAISRNQDSSLNELIVTSIEDSPDNMIGTFATETRKVWTLWSKVGTEKQDEEGNIIATHLNQIGELPIIEFKLNQSFLKGLYSATLQALQMWSMASTGIQKAVFGLPVAFTDDTNIKKIDAGFGKGLILPQNSRFEIHNSDPVVIAKNVEMSNELQTFIQAQMHQRIEEGAKIYSSAKVSGVSKARDKDSQEAFSSYLGEKIAELIPRVVDMYALYYGKQNIETVVRLPEKWVIQDPAEDREKAQAISNDFIPETELEFIAAQKVKRKLYGLEDVMSDQDVHDDDLELEAIAKTKMGPVETPNNIENLPFVVSEDVA